MKVDRRKKKQTVICKEIDESSLEKCDLQEILAYIFRIEPVILGWALADIARYEKNVELYRWVGKLLQLAMLPTIYIADDLLNIPIENIVKSMSREQLEFVIEFVSGFIAEHQPLLNHETLMPTGINKKMLLPV